MPKPQTTLAGTDTAPAGTRTAGKRRTAHIFDLLFKRLLRLSARAIISFINGLFGMAYPLTATVEHLPTESVSGKLRQLRSDSLLRIDGAAGYLIETEIRHGEDMMIRVFEYGLAQGLAEKTHGPDGVRTVKFPRAAVIFWETGDGTAERPQTLRLEFPDGGAYDYTVETFNLLAHGAEELGRRGLAILLPFCILKLRKRVKAAKTAAERTGLAAAMRLLLEELAEAVEGSLGAGIIDARDHNELLNGMERLYDELYGQYEELAKEETVYKVRDGMLVLPIDEARDEGWKKGRDEGREEGAQQASLRIARSFLADGDSPEKVARNTGLPLREVKSLLKAGKEKTAT